MECPECKTLMVKLTTISPAYPGDVSSFIYWCPNDGVVAEKSDWTSKVDKVHIPMMISDTNERKEI